MARLTSTKAEMLVADGHNAADAAFHTYDADDGFADGEFSSPEDSITRPDASGVVGTTKFGFVAANATYTVWHTATTGPLLAARDGRKATVRVRAKGTGNGRQQAVFNATFSCAFTASRQGCRWRVTLPGRNAPNYTPQ